MKSSVHDFWWILLFYQQNLRPVDLESEFSFGKNDTGALLDHIDDV